MSCCVIFRSNIQETHLKVLAQLESSYMVQSNLETTDRDLLRDTSLESTEYCTCCILAFMKPTVV